MYLHLVCQLVDGFQLMEFFLGCTPSVVYVSVHGQDLLENPERFHYPSEVYPDKLVVVLQDSRKDSVYE